jgi:acetyl esterase/lipase
MARGAKGGRARVSLRAVGLAALSALLTCAAAAQASTYQEITGVSYGPLGGERAVIFPALSPGATTVLLVHGGGWHEQTSEVPVRLYARLLQKQGFAVFDILYPQDSEGEGAFPLEPEAIETATTWAIANASTYNANPANVVLVGGSAGGNLAALAAERLDAAAPGTVDGVVSLSGPANLQALVPQWKKPAPALANLLALALGCPRLLGCSESYEREWSPVFNVPPAANCPAWLLFSAQVDEVPLSQSQEQQAALEAGGCDSTLHVVPGSKHSFSYWTAEWRRGERVETAIYSFISAH